MTYLFLSMVSYLWPHFLKLKAEFQEVENASTTPHRKYHKSMSNHVPRFTLAFCIRPRTDSSTEQTTTANLYKVPRKRQLYSPVQDGLYLDFSIGRRTVLAEPGRSNQLSILYPSQAGTSRLLRRISVRDPAPLNRAAQEAAYRPIHGPHPSRFITPQYPKPVSFLLLQRVEEEQPRDQVTAAVNLARRLRLPDRPQSTHAAGPKATMLQPGLPAVKPH